MRSTLLVNRLQADQASLQTLSQQLSSGKRLSQASDDPAAAVGILRINQQISFNTQYTSNLNFASSALKQADSTLSSLSTLVNSATSAASSMVGANVTSSQRSAEASVIDNLLNQAYSYANTQYQHQSLFGGLNTSQSAFNQITGGYIYQGNAGGASILTPGGGAIEYTLDGSTIFGGASQVGGGAALNAALTGSTKIADLSGARNLGVSLGTVNVTIGATTVPVDLSGAATASDVVNLVNAQLTAAGSTATLSVSGGGFAVNGDATQSVTIADTSNGHTAADLGIAGTFAPAVTTPGQGVNAKVTGLTPLSALNAGAGLDPAGFIITSGTGSTAKTATITLAGLNTVQDLVNAINNSGTSVTAKLSADGTGIEVDNNVSGLPVTIGENGGLTATQLGIRSLTAQTELADLNNGTGVTFASATQAGASDFSITRQDGVSFSVDLTGAKTIQDVLNKINTASGNTSPGQVVASLNSSGNGIELTDNSTGSGAFAVTSLNGSAAASQLGILKAAGTPANTINGDDVNPVQPAGLFSSLMKLRDALRNNDVKGITQAGTLLQADANRITQSQGIVGAHEQDVQNRMTDTQNDQLQLQSSLSLLQDTDMTTAITQFQQVQNAYQAALQVGAKQFTMSLMDFVQ
ncbi:MAG: flagellin N-terminal helical domain-containing protein [Phycisphaerae bacterium]